MGGRYYKHMFDGLWETVATAQIAANAASHSFTVDRDDFLDAGLAQVDLAQAQVTFNNYNDPTRLEFGTRIHRKVQPRRLRQSRRPDPRQPRQRKTNRPQLRRLTQPQASRPT